MRELRNLFSNQIIICVLICSFLVTTVDIPLTLPFLYDYFYITTLRNPYTFCLFWLVYEYTLYSMILWLVAFASLERYLLIFHQQIVLKTKRRKFFVHYLPILFVILFCCVWDIYLILLYPCQQTQLDYSQLVCGGSCYQFSENSFLLMIDWTLSSLLPIFLVMLFNLILILHVLHQKRKMTKNLGSMQLRKTWRRTRKMFAQLLPIALIFLLFQLPYVVVNVVGSTQESFISSASFYTNYLPYCLEIFMPFAVLMNQKKIKDHLLRLCTRRMRAVTTAH